MLFLDRDGVINRNRDDYIKSWDEFEFLPGALSALRRLAQLQYRVVVVTNQSLINRGIVSSEVIESINRRMVEEAAADGGAIESVFVCPHRPDENCQCRKPKPGLLFRARDQLGIDLADSCLVGDQPTDIRAALAAGCKTAVLVSNGRERMDLGDLKSNETTCVYVVQDLASAVDLLETGCRDASIMLAM